MCTPITQAETQQLTIDLPGCHPIIVETLGDAMPVGKWVVFRSYDYETDDAATTVGKHFRDALIIAGATGRLGIDAGFDKSTLSFSKDIHEAMRRVDGKELRTEVHGLMTYKKDTVTIIGAEGRGSSTISRDAFALHVLPWIDKGISLNIQQRNCCALLNDSFFVASGDSQFILRISAVEALCGIKEPDEDFKSVVEQLLDYLKTVTTKEDIINALTKTLENSRRKSVRQAYISMFRELIDANHAKEFDNLYGLRSKFAHEGHGRGELAQQSGRALDLAVALLEASLRSSKCKSE